jgi:hypothetical protein
MNLNLLWILIIKFWIDFHKLWYLRSFKIDFPKLFFYECPTNNLQVLHTIFDKCLSVQPTICRPFLQSLASVWVSNQQFAGPSYNI